MKSQNVDMSQYVHDGDVVAVGGYLEQNVPVGLILMVAKLGIRGLTVVAAPSASLGVDLLVAAGCVEKVICPYVGFEGRGAGPALQREVEAGRVERILCDQETLVAGLRAAAQGVACAPIVPSSSDSVIGSPLVGTTTSPFDDEAIWLARRIQVDVALLHAQLADKSRNLYYWGSQFLDLMFAQAANKVVASVDNLIPVPALAFAGSSLSSVWVDAVQELPMGARPTGSHGVYGEDEELVAQYLSREKAGAGAGYAYFSDTLITPKMDVSHV